MIIPGQQLILKFKKDKVWLSSNNYLDLSKTNIEKGYSFFSDVIWEISVVKYFEEEKRLYAKIINYESYKTNFSQTQDAIIDAIEPKRVSFKSIDTHGLLKNAKKINSRISTATTSKIQKQQGIEFEKKDFDFQKNDAEEGNFLSNIKPEEEVNLELEVKKIILNFDVKIKDIDFKNGFFRFKKYVKEVSRLINFEIPNPNLKEEFDSIKNYFANYLQSKSVRVVSEITLRNREEVIECITTSEDLDKINDLVINSMKFEFIKKEFSKRNIEDHSNKGVFTIDELFDSVTDHQVKSKTFYASGEELLRDLIETRAKKHYKQLRYLSSKHLYKTLRLRFILNPFSFIFLLQGNENYFLVWETLDTKEATYLWQIEIEKEVLKAKIKEVEEVIVAIGNLGKRQYISSEPDYLHRIFHDYSDPIVGFHTWKDKIEGLLQGKK